MSDPPDSSTRKSITLPDTMWSDISSFRSQERIATEAEAIRRLLQAALRIQAKKP